MTERLAGGRAELDLSRFPVACLAEHGSLNDAQRVEVMDALDVLLDRRGRHVLVLDLTRGAPLPESQRMYLADHFQLRANEVLEKWAAIAVAVRPPLLQGIPTAAFWLKVSPVPARVFTGLEEAQAWARAQLMHKESGAISATANADKTRRTGGR